MKRITLGTAALALAAGLTIAMPPASASTTADRRCDTIVARYYDKSPSPGLTSLAGYYNNRISEAVRCLINAERAKEGLPPLRMVGPLNVAAGSHVRAAVSLKWWVAEDTDTHTNPQTKSTPVSRIRGAGYCPNARSWAVSETTYTGWGVKGTPRAAVHWWVYESEEGHREIILSPSLTDFGVGVQKGSADPAGAGARNAGTYVVTFGRCQQ